MLQTAPPPLVYLDSSRWSRLQSQVQTAVMIDVERLKSLFPGRECAIEELAYKVASEWPLLFVHGVRGTGKSSVVREALTGLPASMQDLREGASLRDILTRALADYHVSQHESYFDLMAESVCHDASTFVERLLQSKSRKRFFLVLDSADVLLQTDPSLLNCLCKVHELLHHHLQITVILISCQLLHNFLRPGVAFFKPLVVHFESYTKEQLLLILQSRPRPHDMTQDLFASYVQLVLSVLFDVTRNVAEIAFVCDANCDAYLEPIRAGDVRERESAKLWRLFEPRLRVAASSIGLKGQSSVTLDEDMPFTLKFLLVAAFLASFNSKASDKRFFVKEGASRKVSRRGGSGFSSQRCGPKAFPFERLLHIYQSLLCLNFDFEDQESKISCETRLKSSDEVLSLMEDLVSLRLVSRVGSSGCAIASSKRWRLSECVTMEYLNKICQSIQFDLSAHLEQSSHRK